MQTLYSRLQPFHLRFDAIRQRFWAVREVNGVNWSKQVHMPLPVREMWRKGEAPIKTEPYKPNASGKVSRFRPLYKGMTLPRTFK